METEQKSADNDTRFSDKDRKLLRTTKFPPEFEQKVDMRKVELEVMKPWIAKTVNTLLGFEDEVVIEYVSGLLEDEKNPIIDPKKMQVSLTGFLESKTPEFMAELWRLLLSAQASPLRVPPEFIEQKKLEMRARQEKEEKAVARRQEESNHDQQIEVIRQRERRERREQQGEDFRRRPRDSGWDARAHLNGRADRDQEDREVPRARQRRRFESRSPTPKLDSHVSPDRVSPPRRRRRSSTPPRRRYSPSPEPRRRRRDSCSPSPRPRQRRRSRLISRSPPPRSRYADERQKSRSPPPRRRYRSPSPRDRRRGSTPRERDRSMTPDESPRRRDWDEDRPANESTEDQEAALRAKLRRRQVEASIEQRLS